MRFSLSIASLVLASGLCAQTIADDIMIHVGYGGTPPSYSVPFARLLDLDKNGSFANSTEVLPFMEKTFNLGKYAFITDMAQVIQNGRLVWFAADSGGSFGDAFILRLADTNGDGFIQPGEGMIFADFGKGGSGYSPDAVAPFNDYMKRFGVISCHDNSAWKGLWKSVDLNNDGDALDAGETKVWADALSALTIPVKGSTPVPLMFKYPTMVRADDDDEVLYFQGGTFSSPVADENCWLALGEDANGNVKARNFFNPSALNKLERNVDFATGKIVCTDLKWSTTNQANDLGKLVVVPGGFKGRTAYYFASTCGNQRSWGNLNTNGKAIMGLVFRGIDQNNDGDLNDTGEVNLFYNGSGATLKGGIITQNVNSPNYYDNLAMTTTNKCDHIQGITAIGEVVYITYAGSAGNTGDKTILRLEDKNMNFKIDTGEVTQVFAVGSPYPSIWASLYGPYINGIHAIKPTHLPEPQATGVVPFGATCPGSNGLAPLAWGRGGKPVPGNANFSLAISRGPATKPAILAIGNSNKTFSVIPLPLDITFMGATGCSLNNNITMLSQAVLNAQGFGESKLGIPNDPALKGATLYGQYLVLDPTANPAGLTTTDGVAITIQ